MTKVHRSPRTAMLRAIAQCSVARASCRTVRRPLSGGAVDGVRAGLPEPALDEPPEQRAELLHLVTAQAPEETVLDDAEPRLLGLRDERAAVGGDRRVHDARVARTGAAGDQAARLQRVDHARD